MGVDHMNIIDGKAVEISDLEKKLEKMVARRVGLESDNDGLRTGISSLRENLWRQRDNNLSLVARVSGLNTTLQEYVDEHRGLTKKVTIARSHNDTLKSALETGFKELESVIADNEDAMD